MDHGGQSNTSARPDSAVGLQTTEREALLKSKYKAHLTSTPVPERKETLDSPAVWTTCECCSRLHLNVVAEVLGNAKCWIMHCRRGQEKGCESDPRAIEKTSHG